MNWRLRWMDYDEEVYEEYFYTKEEALEFVNEMVGHDFYDLEEV